MDNKAQGEEVGTCTNGPRVELDVRSKQDGGLSRETLHFQ